MANPTVQELARRVLSRCQRDEATGCLTFVGALAKGYGRIGYYAGKGRQQVLQAHRVVYEASRGPIPDGLTIDHLCSNRACQEVTHMEVVTLGENTKRAADRNPTVIANRAKTHCPRNHPYDYTQTGGGRWCRVCQRAANKASYAKRVKA